MIVLWRIATDCNLACGFCAYDRRLPFRRQRTALEEIERVGRLLGSYQATTGEPVLLSWLGGEPLTWPELLGLSERLHKECGIGISATTNGTSLHRANVLNTVLSSFEELTISVDAVGEAHEQLRGWPGGWSRLERAVRTLVARRDPARRLRLRANVVLMRSTAAGFPQLCEALAEWGIDEITFNQLGGRDRPEFHRTEALDTGDIARLRAHVAELRPALARAGVRLCGSDAYLDRLDASARTVPMPVTACRLPRQMLFIDEGARVAPCSFTVTEYGRATTTLHGIEDLHHLRDDFMARQRALPARACGDCHSTQLFAKFAS